MVTAARHARQGPRHPSIAGRARLLRQCHHGGGLMKRLNRLRMRRRTDWLLAVLDALTVIVVIWGVDRMLHRAMTPARFWSVAIVLAALLGARTSGLYRRRALRPGAHLAGPALSTAG